MKLEHVVSALETVICVLEIYKNDIYNSVVEQLEEYVNYDSVDSSDELISDFMEAIGNIKDINRSISLLNNLLQQYQDELLIQQHNDESE